MEAIILCGGKGRRLRPITDDVPKPLVEVQGKTLLDHQITWLQHHDVEHVVLAAGYMHDMIAEHMAQEYPDLSYDIMVEKEPLGPIGGIRNAMDAVSSDAVVACNVDDLTNVDLEQVQSMGANVMCVAHPQCPFGIVELGEDEHITGFRQKPVLEDRWVNIGVYYLATDLQAEMPEKGGEQEFFPRIDLRAHRHDGYWHTVNTKKQLDQAQTVSLATV